MCLTEAAVDGSRDVKEAGPRLGFEVPPEVVGAAEERDVARVLGVGKADDARVAVARAAVVAGLELLQAQAVGAGLGEVVEGGAAHGTQPHHDSVIPAETCIQSRGDGETPRSPEGTDDSIARPLVHTMEG